MSTYLKIYLRCELERTGRAGSISVPMKRKHIEVWRYGSLSSTNTFHASPGPEFDPESYIKVDGANPFPIILNMCFIACTLIYTHTTYLGTHIYTYIPVYTYVYTYIPTHTLHTHSHIYLHTYTYTHPHIPTCTYIHLHNIFTHLRLYRHPTLT